MTNNLRSLCGILRARIVKLSGPRRFPSGGLICKAHTPGGSSESAKTQRRCFALSARLAQWRDEVGDPRPFCWRSVTREQAGLSRVELQREQLPLVDFRRRRKKQLKTDPAAHIRRRQPATGDELRLFHTDDEIRL